MRKKQIEEYSKIHKLQKDMSKEEIAEYNRRIAEQNKMYCYCRGKSGRDPDDFYVM